MGGEGEDRAILLVDDDRDLATMLRLALEHEGLEVLVSSDGKDGLRRFYESEPALVILDIMMPGMDGWTVCERIREMSNTPILIVTARTKDEEIARGLYLGADDYITKPFGIAEFIARVKAVMRRSVEGTTPPMQSLLTVDQRLSIDLAKRRVIIDGKPADNLSPTEQRLLSVLVAHAGEVVDSETLLDRVWGEDTSRDSGHLKTYIHYLRAKIEADPSRPQYILTERGMGYRFAPSL